MKYGTRQCYKCKEWKERSEFNITSKNISHSYCKPCQLEYNRNYHNNYMKDENNRKLKLEKQRKLRAEGGRSRIGQLFHTSKNGAIRRGLEHSLTLDLLHTLFIIQDWKCRQTGILFDFSTMKGKRSFGPTIDRIDNSRGYTIDNIQIVCNIYNMAKNEFTHDDVMKFAIALIERNRK